MFLAQKYMSEEDVIRAAGRKEAINVAEFKGVSQLDFAVKIEPVSGDFDTMFGKLTELEIIAQYFGKDLPLEIKASLIKAFPHMNKEPAIMEMMVDYEGPLNACLALDRGEEFIPSMRDDEVAMLKRLTLRTRESDYRLWRQKFNNDMKWSSVSMKRLRRKGRGSTSRDKGINSYRRKSR